MTKLENASGNLTDVSAMIINGEEVQFLSLDWINYDPEKHDSIFSEGMLACEWRRKPSAFEKVYKDFAQARFPSVYEISKDQAKHFWNAAMEHKE